MRAARIRLGGRLGGRVGGAGIPRRAVSIGIAVMVAAVPTIVVAADGPGDLTLYVNSLASGGPDAQPGDRKCETAGGDRICTLRAAIEESNAIAGQVPVTILADPQLETGNIEVLTNKSTWMRLPTPAPNVSAGGSAWGDEGAIFEVKQPVTIDLGHKVTIHSAGNIDSVSAAVFHLNAPSVGGRGTTITGIDDVYSSETSFYVGPKAADVTITDVTARAPGANPERFLLVRGGSSNVTLSDSTVSGFGPGGRAQRWSVVDGTSSSMPVNGLTIENVDFLAQATGDCSISDARGCSTTAIDLVSQYVTSLTFRNNRVPNISRASNSGARALDLRGATITSLEVDGNTFDAPFYRGTSLIDTNNSTTVASFSITDNMFTNMDGNAQTGAVGAVIELPQNKSFTGVISGNAFIAVGSGLAAPAIYWDGPFAAMPSTAASHLSIVGNHFDGFPAVTGSTGVRLYESGFVEVRRNTFGPRSGSQTDTTFEEFIGDGKYKPLLVNNAYRAANGGLNTWYPTARTSANTQSAKVEAVGCVVPLEVAPPSEPGNTHADTSARYPAVPLELDVYWTSVDDAEVYLGAYPVTSKTRQTLQVSLPVAGDSRLATNDGVGPVDPETGEVSGGLRVQTLDPNAAPGAVASSQYSRVATIGGTCLPVLTIDRAVDQNEPALGRDLHFTAVSSMPLDPESVTPDDVSVSAVATADTIDAERLNPRVVSVTEVPGSQGLRFDVVVRVDDSATVTVGMGAGTVMTLTGESNAAAATSTDNSVTFVNPLEVAPPRFALVTGEPHGKDYVLAVKAGAPAPAQDLVFTSTVTQPGGTPQVSLSTHAPVITAGAMQSGPVTVTAAAGDEADDVTVTVAGTVRSGDPNYDGLAVPRVRVSLFSVDPSIQLDKRAYTAPGGGTVFDISSPERIMATGSPAPKGTRLMHGQLVCFVYTVRNTSAGTDWVTTLTEVQVTDTRLGKDGLIGTIPSLAPGGTAMLSDCAALTPGGTTTSDATTFDPAAAPGGR